VKSLVVDAVEVGDLVDESGVYLIAQLADGFTSVEVGFSVDDDAVRELTGSVPFTFRQGEPVIETEKIERAVLRLILDDEHDVVEAVDHRRGQQIDLVSDEIVECVRIHFDHVDLPTGE